MVQLSAAGLGVPTNNVGAGLAEALQMGTMGWLQGAKLKLAREQSQREQDAENRAAAADKADAAAKAQAARLLSQDPYGPIQPNAPQDQGRPYGPLQPTNALGQVENPYALKPNGVTGRAKDFADLTKHHQEVAALSSQIALTMKDPQAFLQGIRQKMAVDAGMLTVSHAADDAHEGILSGRYDAIDRRTGERVPNPEMRKHVAELIDQLRSGAIPFQQFQQDVGGISSKLMNEAADVRDHISYRTAITKKIEELGANATPEMNRFAAGLDVMDFDIEDARKKGQYIMAGMVPDPRGTGGWMTPDDAKATAAKIAADTARAEAQAYQTFDRPALDRERLRLQEENNLLRAQLTGRGLDIKEKQGEDNLKLGRDRIVSAEKISVTRLEEAARKAATEAGFSDQKALDKALERALQMYESGLLKKGEFQAKVVELREAFSTPKSEKKKSEANPDEVKLIGEMKAAGKSNEEIRAAVLKMRGGK